MNQRILLIEDEDVILKALRRLLERNHYDVVTATDIETARSCEPHRFDLVLADLRLPGAAGTDIIPIADPVPVIIMTSHASVRSAVSAMREGAIDYIAKPFDHDELLLVIKRSLMQNRLQTQNRALKTDIERLIPAMRYVSQTSLEPLMHEASAMLSTQHVLYLTGEAGSGRELIARAVHASTQDSDAPLVIIECVPDSARKNTALDLTTMAPSLDEQGLDGQLIAAQSGTLVLRHPERWGQARQQQLLELLRADGRSGHANRRQLPHSIILLGSAASTQRNEAAQLLPELAEVLASFQRDVPPLRCRRQDITPLAERLIEVACQRYDRVGLSLTPSSEATLVAADWTGNLGELANTLFRAVLVARGSAITPADLGVGDDNTATRDLSLDEYFRYFVSRHQGALSETEIAAGLGISRKALWERRQRMKLSREPDPATIVDNSAQIKRSREP